jgi:hypothetical protein
MSLVQRRSGRDGRKLVDALFAVAFGTPDQVEKVFHDKHLDITMKDRLRAIELLLDRGWGKPFVPEDDTPFIQTSGAGPTLVFNIPRPARELEGQNTVVDALNAPAPESEP